MRNTLLWAVLVLVGMAGFALRPASAQTDVAFSLYGSFPEKTNGNVVVQSPAVGAGGLFQLRHISNPILGFEATYSFNRANQRYTSDVAVTCPIPPAPCPALSTSVASNAHEITIDWVPSLKIANLRPFGLLGVGVLLDVPSGHDGSETDTKPVYLYGAGLDIGLVPHIGLRLQYRGNLNEAPDVSLLFTSSKAFMHTAQPMAGVYIRF